MDTTSKLLRPFNDPFKLLCISNIRDSLPNDESNVIVKGNFNFSFYLPFKDFTNKHKL